MAAAIGFWGAKNSASRAALSIGGAFLPVLIFSVNYIRIENFSSSWLYSFIALVIFAVFLAVSNFIFTTLREDDEGRDGACAAYSVAAFVALALCISVVLEKAALSVALAMLVPAIAFVYYRRPLPALRSLTVFASLLWVARVVWDPTITGGALSTTPIFNWLTYGYAIPTIGFGFATWLIGLEKRDKWLEAMEAITLASFVATIGLVWLHAIDPSQVFTAIDSLTEVALVAIIGGGVAIALLMIKRTNSSKILNLAVTFAGVVGMIGAAGGLLVIYNPWFNYAKSAADYFPQFYYLPIYFPVFYTLSLVNWPATSELKYM